MADPYIQENGTLKNKLGIEDYTDLNNAEKNITFTKFLNISTAFRTNFDIEYFKSIHKHIFEDIFDWAGEFRTVPIYKTELVVPGISLNYAPVKQIEPQLQTVFDEMNNIDWNSLPTLDQKASTFTKCLTKIWAIHPFRDGNTRATLTFANQYSKEHGFPIDLGGLLDKLPRKVTPSGQVLQYSIRDLFVLAALPEDSYPEPEHLTALIKQAMQKGIEQHIEILQNNLNNDSATKKEQNSPAPNSTKDDFLEL